MDVVNRHVHLGVRGAQRFLLPSEFPTKPSRFFCTRWWIFYRSIAVWIVGNVSIDIVKLYWPHRQKPTHFRKQPKICTSLYTRQKIYINIMTRRGKPTLLESTYPHSAVGKPFPLLLTIFACLFTSSNRTGVYFLRKIYLLTRQRCNFAFLS